MLIWLDFYREHFGDFVAWFCIKMDMLDIIFGE